MPSKFPHRQPWQLVATRTLQYLPRLRLIGRPMAYMPRRNRHPNRRLWRELFCQNSMGYSRSNDEFANLRRQIFMLLFLIIAIPSEALKGISDERNHNKHHCHHGSKVEVMEDRFVSNGSTDFIISHNRHPPEGYGCQQIKQKRMMVFTLHQLHPRNAQYQEHPGSGLACEHIGLRLANVKCAHGIPDKRCVDWSGITTTRIVHILRRHGGGVHVHCFGHVQMQLHAPSLGLNPRSQIRHPHRYRTKVDLMQSVASPQISGANLARPDKVACLYWVQWLVFSYSLLSYYLFFPIIVLFPIIVVL